MVVFLANRMQVDQADPTFWDNAKYTAIYLGVFTAVVAVLLLAIYIINRNNQDGK